MSNEMQEIEQISAPSAGFFNFNSFNEAMQAAQVLSRSNIVPTAYQAYVEKKNYGKPTGQYDENPNAAANCLVALNMASRMGADPLMVMQNLYIIEGRPAWSSQFLIAAVNSCGRFTALRFDITKGDKKEVTYQVAEWNNKVKTMVDKTETINEMSCVAWAIEKSTGDRIESSPITMELAIKEGWYQKSGSKWQTMPEQMLRYRAAAFFARVYAPEVTMGIYTKDEVEDFTKARDVTPASQPNNEPVIEYVDAEQADILTKMIACITDPESKANINKAIPDVNKIPAAHFDSYQNKLRKTIDTQIIKDEQASYTQEQASEVLARSDTDKLLDSIKSITTLKQGASIAAELEAIEANEKLSINPNDLEILKSELIKAEAPLRKEYKNILDSIEKCDTLECLDQLTDVITGKSSEYPDNGKHLMDTLSARSEEIGAQG